MGVSAAQGSAGLKPGVCTSTTRPSNPFEGQMIYETDTDIVAIWTGAAWQTIFTASASPVPFRYQVGTTSGSGTFTVTFAASRFTVAPMVVSQPKSIGSAVSYDFTNTPTTSGFTIERNVSGTWSSQWIAIQATSGAGAGP